MARHRAEKKSFIPAVAQSAVVLASVVGVVLLTSQAAYRTEPAANGHPSARIESQFLALNQAANQAPSPEGYQPAPVPYVGPPVLDWSQELPTIMSHEMASNAPSLAPIVPEMPQIDPSVWDEKGQIVSDTAAIDLLPALRDSMGAARRATYRSVSGLSGAATEVSGIFFVPKGTPPPGGWPVISFAHGTTGMNTDCAASSRADLYGYGSSVASFLTGGVAVAFTDYEGLGGPGLHPYLEPRTAGFNVIDAVRGLRALFPGVSPRWLSFGMSQGGQASWAANEVSQFYGGGLDLLGSVALAPAVNVSAIAELAFSQQLTPEQLAMMPLAVMAVQRSFPSVPVDHLLHSAALDNRDVLIGCESATDEMRLTMLTPADVKPTSRTDAGALAQGLQMLALPRAPVSAPLLVVSGSADQLLFQPWIRSAVARSCDMGGQIEYVEQPGAKHADVVANAQVVQWMTDRLAGKPAETNCPAKQ